MYRKIIKIPTLGFIFLALAFVCSIVSLILYVNTYNIGEYNLNRWALMCGILTIYFILFLLVNALFKGDNAIWTHLVYGVIVFLVVYGCIKFIQPCLTPIGIYVSGVAMGDNELNEAVTFNTIYTVTFYLLTIVFTIISSFMNVSKEGRHNHE